MFDICQKHQNVLHHIQISDKYDIKHLTLLPEDFNTSTMLLSHNQWRGYPGFLEGEGGFDMYVQYLMYGVTYNQDKYNIQTYKEIRKEILETYIQIHQLISPFIRDSMISRFEYRTLTKSINSIKRSIKTTDKRIQRLQKQIHKDSLSNITQVNKLTHLQEKLASTPNPFL
jgi:hypothetical protein